MNVIYTSFVFHGSADLMLLPQRTLAESEPMGMIKSSFLEIDMKTPSKTSLITYHIYSCVIQLMFCLIKVLVREKSWFESLAFAI